MGCCTSSPVGKKQKTNRNDNNVSKSKRRGTGARRGEGSRRDDNGKSAVVLFSSVMSEGNEKNGRKRKKQPFGGGDHQKMVAAHPPPFGSAASSPRSAAKKESRGLSGGTSPQESSMRTQSEILNTTKSSSPGRSTLGLTPVLNPMLASTEECSATSGSVCTDILTVTKDHTFSPRRIPTPGLEVGMSIETKEGTLSSLAGNSSHRSDLPSKSVSSRSALSELNTSATSTLKPKAAEAGESQLAGRHRTPNKLPPRSHVDAKTMKHIRGWIDSGDVGGFVDPADAKGQRAKEQARIFDLNSTPGGSTPSLNMSSSSLLRTPGVVTSQPTLTVSPSERTATTNTTAFDERGASDKFRVQRASLMQHSSHQQQQQLISGNNSTVDNSSPSSSPTPDDSLGPMYAQQQNKKQQQHNNKPSSRGNRTPATSSFVSRDFSDNSCSTRNDLVVSASGNTSGSDEKLGVGIDPLPGERRSEGSET